MNGGAKCPGAFAVHNAHVADSPRRTLVQIRGNQFPKIAGLKRVQIQLSRDRQWHRSVARFRRRGRAHDGFSGDALAGGGVADFGGAEIGGGGGDPGGEILGSTGVSLLAGPAESS
jgi:hypothetical protein